MLLDLLDNEVIEKDDVTFCIWQDKNHKEWQKGNVEIPEGCDDGSNYMLSRIFSSEGYIDWAKDYWELGERLTFEDVKKVFNHQPITEEMVKKINTDRNIKKVMEELIEINYPVEYKF
ncbi:hypothetical protein [Clostridium saccharoperbutylacetonicum]|uniref:hypothetical protein n=1 Tax=Clostridium saccharoperbutylacetonicum TaxID=36745 RepID=UPI0039E9234F